MYFNAALHRKCTALCQASFIDADATGEGGGARGRRVSRQRLQKPCPFQRAVFGFKGRLLKGPLGLGLGPRVFLPLGRRDRVAAGEPAVQIDVGAALRAERPKPRRGRLAADRAFARAGNRIGHAIHIGMAGAEGKSTAPGRRRRPTSPMGR